jgi:hypothetical protein
VNPQTIRQVMQLHGFAPDARVPDGQGVAYSRVFGVHRVVFLFDRAEPHLGRPARCAGVTITRSVFLRFPVTSPPLGVDETEVTAWQVARQVCAQLIDIGAVEGVPRGGLDVRVCAECGRDSLDFIEDKCVECYRMRRQTEGA